MVKVYDSFLWWLMLWLPDANESDAAWYFTHNLVAPPYVFFWDSIARPSENPASPWEISQARQAYITGTLKRIIEKTPQHQ